MVCDESEKKKSVHNPRPFTNVVVVTRPEGGKRGCARSLAKYDNGKNMSYGDREDTHLKIRQDIKALKILTKVLEERVQEQEEIIKNLKQEKNELKALVCQTENVEEALSQALNLLKSNPADFSDIQTPPVSHAPVTVSVPLPGSVKSQPVVNNSHTASSQPVTAATGFDLFNDLGSDLFATTGPSSNSHSDGGFEDFGNFDSFSTPAGQISTAPIHAPLQTFPISNTPLQPVGIGPTAVQPTAATAKAPSAKPVSISNTDRYAALADFDSAFSAPVTTATSINWGGTDGGAH
ncbi:hypothetical protein Btru_038242 [Bulinus truncatus]|nr:hypothetical protein Btru_038242 [Bulinus truncatus]